MEFIEGYALALDMIAREILQREELMHMLNLNQPES